MEYNAGNEGSASAVSWGAIAGGAFAASALALSLLALGAGAGLSSLSPWSTSAVIPSAVGVGALVWLAVTEVIASGIGGYLTGRLRTKWVNVHSDEVFFRDTAHGFLAWAVAFVISAGFLASAASTMVGRETRGGSASRSADGATESNRYFIDNLFRSTQPAAVDAATRTEVGAIFMHALRERALTTDDRTYVAQAVASKTGLSSAAADKRVTDVFERNQQAIDTARKAVAHSLYWLFAALLLGAFSASWAATLGGRQRDHVHP